MTISGNIISYLAGANMEAGQQPAIPRWVWKLIARLSKLEGGQVYRLTLIVPPDADVEPTWAIEAAARLENGR